MRLWSKIKKAVKKQLMLLKTLLMMSIIGKEKPTTEIKQIGYNLTLKLRLNSL